MRTSFLVAATIALSAAACSSSESTPPTHPGDLGGSSAIIDHSGSARGYLAPSPTGPVQGASWTPPTCAGTVDLAAGVTDASWSSEDYGSDPSPRGVHTSWRFDTATSLAVVWDTEPNTRATTLAMGDSPDKLDRFVNGVSFTYATAEFDTTASPVRIHEAHVCGLEPNRTYYFAVGGDGYYGKVYSVKTAPTFDPNATFRVGVVGDSNNLVYDEFTQVASQLGKEAPDWIAFTGDLVHDGAWQSQWERWLVAAGDTIAKAPTMPAHGNHEAMATGYFAHFALPGNEEYYSFDYAQAHFLVLNDSPPQDSEFDVEAKFADDDLAAALARPNPPVWIVAMHHRPPYCSNAPYLNDRVKFQPVYDKYHVDLVLNGHEHLYESTLPLKGDSTIAKSTAEGTVYVTVAGGGGTLDDTFTAEPWSRTHALTFNYAVIDVEGSKLTVHAKKDDGTSIEDLVITK
jgi:hypothetical protein